MTYVFSGLTKKKPTPTVRGRLMLMGTQHSTEYLAGQAYLATIV